MSLSIITINYNNINGLKLTTESILKQSDQNFQWIVIDGASKDGGAEFIKEIQRENSVLISEPDHGIYHAMNKGVRHAKGDFCLFMNSGDLLYAKDTIKHCLDFIAKNSEMDILRCGVEEVKNGKHIDYVYPIPVEKWGGVGVYLLTHSIAHQGTMIRTALLRNYPYDENFKILGDCDFFLHAYLHIKIKDVTSKVVIAKYDCSGISSTNYLLSQQERKVSFMNQTSPVIYEDYLRFCNGGNFLERMVCKSKKNIITYWCSVLVMLPIYLFLCANTLFRHFPFFLRRIFSK